MGSAIGKIRDARTRDLVKELIAAGYTVQRRGNRWQVRYGSRLLLAISDKPADGNAVKNARTSIANNARANGLPTLGGS